MRAVRVVACVVVAGALCSAEDLGICHDAKMESAEPAAQLYAISPFVHGYRDGYHRGFHDADIDQQFAHQASRAEAMRDYREVRYRSEFRDKESYVSGFRAGFLRGHSDMEAGLDFRLFSILDMAKKTEALQIAVSQPATFNQGIKQGYMALHRGGTSVQEKSKQSGTARLCSADSTAPFCAGVRLGEALASAEQLQTAQK